MLHPVAFGALASREAVHPMPAREPIKGTTCETLGTDWVPRPIRQWVHPHQKSNHNGLKTRANGEPLENPADNTDPTPDPSDTTTIEKQARALIQGSVGHSQLGKDRMKSVGEINILIEVSRPTLFEYVELARLERSV